MAASHWGRCKASLVDLGRGKTGATVKALGPSRAVFARVSMG